MPLGFDLKPNLIAIYETNRIETQLSKAWDQIFGKIITSTDEEQNMQWITDGNLMDGIRVALHSKLDYKFCLLYFDHKYLHRENSDCWTESNSNRIKREPFKSFS